VLGEVMLRFAIWFVVFVGLGLWFFVAPAVGLSGFGLFWFIFTPLSALALLYDPEVLYPGGSKNDAAVYPVLIGIIFFSFMTVGQSGQIVALLIAAFWGPIVALAAKKRIYVSALSEDERKTYLKNLDSRVGWLLIIPAFALLVIYNLGAAMRWEFNSYGIATLVRHLNSEIGRDVMFRNFLMFLFPYLSVVLSVGLGWSLGVPTGEDRFDKTEARTIGAEELRKSGLSQDL
jgi:hypothetical protein